MRKQTWPALLCVTAIFSAHAVAGSDQFTPLAVSALTPGVHPFPGTDGRVHLVYELVFTNTTPTPVTLNKIDVIDAANQSTVVTSYAAGEVKLRLRQTNSAPAQGATIEFNASRLFLIDFTIERGSALPPRLLHRVNLLGAPMPGHRAVTPVPLSYIAAPLEISHELPQLAAPLAGKGWVAVNGCCGLVGVHRGAGLTINGKIYFAQRFAIDWMLLDKNNRMVHGDPADVHNYADYGAAVLAVADGVVVETLNNLTDQKPGTLPDPKTITVANVDGNHVILDLGDGVFAFYAHMQTGSVTVKPGDRVKRGDVLGKLGNTGNTSAPHLHFQLMQGPSALGSNGIPYVLDRFLLAGQVNAAAFGAAVGVEGDWGKGIVRSADVRKAQFPLDLNIVDFSDK